ncbi:MAG: ParB/RepB/Spo0J family partition protein [Acidimicrobiales bacterium]
MARRSGLGKGLGALIPTEVTGDRRSRLREVPIGSVRPNALQPRTHFDEEAMSSLAASVRELGVLQPVLVRQVEGDGEECYELIAGERRWRAARRAGLQAIPVLVQEGTDGAHSLEQALVENLHREDLNPLEEAAAYQQLIDDFSFTHERVATRVGRSRAAVTNTLRLLQLPTGVQRALAEGAVTAGHARALLGTPDRALQEALVQRIVAEGLTVRAVEELVRAAAESPGPGAAAGPDDGTTNGNTSGATRPGGRRLPEPGILELEELLSSHLDTRVKVELRNRRGRVVVEFATLEDLERIYRVMVEGRRPDSDSPASPS